MPRPPPPRPDNRAVWRDVLVHDGISPYSASIANFNAAYILRAGPYVAVVTDGGRASFPRSREAIRADGDLSKDDVTSSHSRTARNIDAGIAMWKEGPLSELGVRSDIVAAHLLAKTID